MIVKPITDKKLIREVIVDSDMWKLTHGEKTTSVPDEYIVPVYLSHLAAYDEDEKLLAILPYKQYTAVMVELHIYVLKEYQGTGLSLEIGEKFYEWIKDNTTYLKGMVTAPATCEHSINYLLRMGFFPEAHLKHAMVYNHELVGLFIFTREIV